MENDKNLQAYNTFGLAVNAKYFTSIRNEVEFKHLLNTSIFQGNHHFIIGGGSNVLFTENFDGLLIHNEIKGIEIIEEDSEKALVEFKSGENWHDCVQYCINKELGGIENLSLIPGSVGAAPIQNIGAYGVELKDTFHSLTAISLKTGEDRVFDKLECEFAYRNSIFKKELKGEYFISSVRLELTKKPKLNIAYGAITQVLNDKNIEKPSIKDISQAVMDIRRSKLPDPEKIGNSGSFFKNPVIPESAFEELKKNHPDIPSYPAEEGVKIPAGWLIEKLGWKGYRDGNIGVHKNQALVLVNYGGGDGAAIFELSKKIQENVKQIFDIDLEAEVNIIR